MSIYTSNYPGDTIDVPSILAALTFLIFFAAVVFLVGDKLGRCFKNRRVPTFTPSEEEAQAIRHLKHFCGITPHDDAFTMLESMRIAIRAGHNPEYCLKYGDCLHPDLEMHSSISAVIGIAEEYLACLEDMSEEQEP